MAHEITETDNVLLNREKAWHGLGMVVQEDHTAMQACEKVGLNWDVTGWPVLARNPVTGELVEVPGHKANVREIPTPEGSVHSVLGLVTDSYEICQNRQLAEFVDALAQTGKVTIESCGSIRGGRRVWFLAKADAFDIGGDRSYNYLLASNAHDGTGAIRLDPTQIRVVCSNTLHMVIPDGVGQGSDAEPFQPAAISIRHSGQIESRLLAAKKALEQFGEIKAAHQAHCERLAERRINRRQAISFFAQMYAGTFNVPEEATNSRSKDIRTGKMDRAARAFLDRYTAECKKFGGESAWLAMNAWTGYLQHDTGKSGKKSVAERHETQTHSRLFGQNRQRTVETLVQATSMFLSA